MADRSDRDGRDHDPHDAERHRRDQPHDPGAGHRAGDQAAEARAGDGHERPSRGTSTPDEHAGRGEWAERAQSAAVRALSWFSRLTDQAATHRPAGDQPTPPAPPPAGPGRYVDLPRGPRRPAASADSPADDSPADDSPAADSPAAATPRPTGALAGHGAGPSAGRERRPPAGDDDLITVDVFPAWAWPGGARRPPAGPAAGSGPPAAEPTSTSAAGATSEPAAPVVPGRTAPVGPGPVLVRPKVGYALIGGEADAHRLDAQSRALAPGTTAFLTGLGLRSGWRCIDVGCGHGQVTLLLAGAVGSSGRVVGVDGDPDSLAVARRNVARRNVARRDVARRDVARRDLARRRAARGDDAAQGEAARWYAGQGGTPPGECADEDATPDAAIALLCSEAGWLPVRRGRFDLAYSRLLLSHLADPLETLRAMTAAVRPGGTVAVEDVYFDHAESVDLADGLDLATGQTPVGDAGPDADRGRDPSGAGRAAGEGAGRAGGGDGTRGAGAGDGGRHAAESLDPALAALFDLIAMAVRAGGGDPTIGPRLPALFAAAGLVDIRVTRRMMPAPENRAQTFALEVLAATRATILRTRLATDEQLDRLVATLAESPGLDQAALATAPRLYQVSGHRPDRIGRGPATGDIPRINRAA